MSRYARLARSGDPLVREMGDQLAAGTVRPGALLAVPEYRAAIQRGLDRLLTASQQERVRRQHATGPARTERVSD